MMELINMLNYRALNLLYGAVLCSSGVPLLTFRNVAVENLREDLDNHR